MTLPYGLLGAGLAFWGWQTGNVAVGLGLAALVEGARWSTVRFALRDGDCARVADLCVVLFLGVLATGAATRGMREGIVVAVLWLPVLLAPLVLAQRLSSAGRVPLSALFQHLRRRERRDPAAHDPAIDLSGVHLALCVVAAGLGNLRTAGYYIGAVVLTAWALHATRPRHVPVAGWAAMIALAGGIGYAGQAGLGQLQAVVEDWATEWYLRGMDADPYRASTDIGSIGRLKLRDAIVLRVYAEAGSAGRLRLLHRASYTTYSGTTWHARRFPLAPLTPREDGTTWVLGDGTAALRVKIATRLEDGKALLALPAGTVRVSELAAAALERNALGAVRAEVGGEWAIYVAETGHDADTATGPGDEDLGLPRAERETIEQVAHELGLAGLAPAEALARIERHFATFSYSTFRESAPPPGTTALADFLLRSRSGHCEYFAAATTLLLRAAGIPARYATGFAMLERSELEQAYVVRARHAHAWSRAWIDGRWVDVDTTPPDWFGVEERRAPLWQPLADVLRWAGFRWAQRPGFEPGATSYGLIVLLVAALAWRLFRGRRLRRVAGLADAPASHSRHAPDSEFYAVERALAERVSPREPGETLTGWVARVGSALTESTRAHLDRAVGLHLRHRFDPAGLDGSERAALREAAVALVEQLERQTGR
jgi:hypothetical protein